MTNTLPEASTETPLDTFGDVKAEALVHTRTCRSIRRDKV